MIRLRGKNVAGMGGDPAGEGMPTAWTTYIAIDDADAAAGRITEHGGQVMMGPMDVMSQGRMVVAADPTGAVFGMWQAGDHIGASLVNEPGTVVWNEIATRDLDAAQAFYGAVFGYAWNDEDTGGGSPAYRTFKLGDRVVGGALQMTADWPADVPSHWMPYFGVTDTDATAATAERRGGTVLMLPKDTPYGRFAVLGDPQGGVFTVLQVADQPDA
jgi:predicted enzyme related to lactoylglutathione lyase